MNRVNKVLAHLSSGDTKEDSTLASKECSDFLLQNNSGNTSGFRYTLDGFSDVLSAKQRQFYEDNGYIVFPKLLNAQEVKYFYNRFEELILNPELRPEQMIVMRDVSLRGVAKDRALRTDPSKITKLQNWSREPGLWKYVKNDKIVKYVRAFCGDNIRGVHFMVINKPADPGKLSSRHPFHQDQWYFPFGPSDHIVCSWTALEPVHRRNGCLSVIPGSHKNPPGGKLLNHDYPKQWHGPVNAAYHGVQVDDINPIKRKRVHLEMGPGDTVLFHPLLLHSSGANLTQNSRRSISCHYASSTLCKYHNFEKAGQKVIADDVAKIAKKKLGMKGEAPLPFAAIWGVKSRQVCGNEGNLSLQKAMQT